MKQSTGRGSDQFNLRFPEGMRDRIAVEADKAGRSMNAEIITRLSFTLEDNIWERQKFIDTLNFKQHMLEKTGHMLFRNIAEMRAMKNEVEHERALRISQSNTIAALCNAILAADVDEKLKETANFVLSAAINPETHTDMDALQEELDRQIGDTEDVPPNWKEQLSDEDAENLSESRKWVKDFE
ncbi:Arc family DNA-binding protein [Agrobacterium pusense]|uniref:Arc family DNA-binding protein n=1 Tax=Agrobacterium pusense TaxID=648995 RepID=UPI0028997991|nr:Arc family DNA-binding protein [Agrobacterium pusense]